ncbi:MAG: hypothetical protein AAF298_13955 [Cyanobacteria bacterium P01_A01_bin.40]
MSTGEKRQIKIGFPFNLYLKQLFSTDSYVRDINPFSFWRRYRINHLETCHELNTVQYLERCFQLDWRSVKPTKNSLALKKIDTSGNNLIKQERLKKVYISRPQIELKYRGVSYYRRMQSEEALSFSEGVFLRSEIFLV